MMSFEQKLPTEQADIAEIVRDILTVQARSAAEQNRPLARGTHTKGVCARATFEVFELKTTIGDPALAKRLAQGIYAKPGLYPAAVRFANATLSVYADSRPDIRALSFSVELPPGIVGTDAARQDYAMNNAATFPINDAHAFASVMKIAAATSKAETAKALWSLSLTELWGLVRTGMRGRKQERPPALPYQQTRYWSNVPFRHGPSEAVKYSAIPAPSNPSQPLHHGPNLLGDELVRHVNEDRQMSAFDFAVQFLDADRMTHRGTRQAPSFWIENASVEWIETEAPFHVIGRLTLVAGSILPADECQATYIDVTEHSTPDTQPLGSINRARWYAEAASRKARLGDGGLKGPAD